MSSPSKPQIPVVWAIGEAIRRRYPSIYRLILIILANHMNGVRECWPSVAYVAEECGCSGRVVRYALRRFEADGLIAVTRGVGRNNTSRYQLLAATAAYQPDLFGEQTEQPPKVDTPQKPKPRKARQGVHLPAPEKVNPVHHLPPGKAAPDDTEKVNLVQWNPPLESTSTDSGLRPGNAVAFPQSPSPDFDPRKVLWTEGRESLRKLTGQLNGEAGKQIGRFLKLANGDAVAVLRALEAATVEGPYEPIPWITEAIKVRAAKRLSPQDELRQRWGLTSFVTPGGAA